MIFLSFQLLYPQHQTFIPILNMDLMIVILLGLLAVVFAFGAAGMAQMLHAQKPIKGSGVPV
jgi:hypothetical protein